MCICCVVGGVLLVILEMRRKAGKNPSPGGADDIMGTFLISFECEDALRVVYNVNIQQLSA